MFTFIIICLIYLTSRLPIVFARYEDEKEALMRTLKGADAKYLSEKERQAEMVRIRRELRRVEQEENFTAVALVFGLSERNQAAVESR